MLKLTQLADNLVEYISSSNLLFRNKQIIMTVLKKL